MKANGVEFLVRGNHGMTHSAYIADPDGYGLEVLYNLPADAWGGDVDAAPTTSRCCLRTRSSKTPRTTSGSARTCRRPRGSRAGSSPSAASR